MPLGLGNVHNPRTHSPEHTPLDTHIRPLDTPWTHSTWSQPIWTHPSTHTPWTPPTPPEMVFEVFRKHHTGMQSY